jgi:hypothetical protein
MKVFRETRDAQGNIPQEKAKRGSYAELRRAELKAERKKYNVDHLGFYSGGLPSKDTRLPSRGGSLSVQGARHDIKHHNFLERNHQDSAQVDPEDTIQFKNWMQSKKTAINTDS